MSEKQGRGKKRPKSYYLKCAHKKVKHGNSLDIDMRGFLVTCNGNEKQAVREMYNLLNEYADKHRTYVIKFVSDLGQVGGFLWVPRFPSSIKLKVALNNPPKMLQYACCYF
jgi:hypothetical protein